MDMIVSYVKRLLGYQMGIEKIKIMFYADNIALTADTEDDLQIIICFFFIKLLEM